MTEFTVKLTKENLKTEKYWANMLRYHLLECTIYPFMFEAWRYNSDFEIEEIALYLEENGFILKYYRYIEDDKDFDHDKDFDDDYERINQDIIDNVDDIIVTCDFIVEEQTALLTFFDNSRQLVKIIGYENLGEMKNDR